MKLIIRKASVHWRAGAKGGARAVTTESSPRKLASFSSAIRHRNNSHANSAELLATAHAGSFSLALAQELGRVALSVGDIFTLVAVTLEHLAAGWTVRNIHLDVVARLPNVKQGRFIDATVRAKTNCLVSRALRVNISMNAKLEK
jgi:lipoyl-dependent peroxiredoxin